MLESVLTKNTHEARRFAGSLVDQMARSIASVRSWSAINMENSLGLQVGDKVKIRRENDVHSAFYPFEPEEWVRVTKVEAGEIYAMNRYSQESIVSAISIDSAPETTRVPLSNIGMVSITDRQQRLEAIKEHEQMYASVGGEGGG